MKTILLHITFLLLSITVLAQDIVVNIQYFNQKNGLSDRSVFCVNQDDRGLIWIGTGNGLNRFDGVSFQHIENPNDPLASGNIIGIKKTADGHFWVQKRTEGVLRFDPVAEQILDLPLYDEVKGVGDLKLLDPYRVNGKIYFKDVQGQVFYLDDQGKIKQFGKLNIPINSHTIAAPTPWGTVIVNNKVLNYSDSKSIEFDSLGNELRVFSELKQNFNYAIKNDVNPRFTIFKTFASDKFLHELFLELQPEGSLKPLVFNREGEPLKVKDLNIPSGREYYFHSLKDSKGYTWLVANDQIFLFDNKGDFIRGISTQLKEFTDYHWNANQIFLDNHDRLWVSTGLGLFLLEVKPNPFQNYLNKGGNASSCRGILEVSKDTLLFATYAGAKVLDKNTGEILASTKRNFVGVSRGSGDTILLGRHGSEIGTFKSSDLSFSLGWYPLGRRPGECLIPFEDTLTRDFYFSIQNVLYHKKKNGTFEKYAKTNGFDKIHRANPYYYYTKEDAIWIASTQGLFQLDRLKGIVNHYEFPNNDVKHFYEDNSGIFWLATAGGLIKWDQKEEKLIRQYTTKDGLSHNVIYAVYEDENGFLWLPSNNGLMQFDKESEEVVVYLPEDGIPHKEFNTFSHFQAEDGRLYFGGLNGITAFYPKEVNPQINDVPFLITSFQQFNADEGQLVNLSKEILEEPEIVLNPSDKFFTISFSLLDYSARDKIYGWKLEGLDEDWNYQNESSIRINALQYGNYTLHIKAKGAGGQWAVEELSIPVKVLKPFYLETRVILFFILSAILLTWGIIRYRTAQFRRRARQLSKEVDLRTQTIRSQNLELAKANQFKDKILALVAHDLRAPLITMSGLTRKINFLIQKNRVDDIAKLSKTIDNSAEGVTNLLDTIMNWALIRKGQFNIEPELLNLNQEIKEVVKLYENTAQAKSIEIKYTFKQNLKAYADRNAFQTIFRNLLNNAIKFSFPENKVELFYHRQQHYTVIEIKDHGVGIAPERLKDLFNVNRKNRIKGTNGELGSGLGLALCKELIELNNGKLEVESELNVGTSFFIKLPAHNGPF